MLALTTLAYPCVLAVLCVGAGLLVDRASGGFLPAALLPAVGAAALLAVTQLTTAVGGAAPSTPYALAAVSAGGLALGWRRARSISRTWRPRGWQLAVPVLAYAIALAPVLAAGRPTFSSYQLLTDSALHMMGADYLMHHGQEYAHLDLRNSYGAYLQAYYGTSYPSGADTLFGGSAFLLRLPLIWAFQPFNAFMLATSTGAAWVLARRIGLDGLLAALAALVVTLPALVYGYELIGSVKEIVALSMILTLGALAVLHRRWLERSPSAAIPFALVVAAGLSALGVAFGAWALAAAAVPAVVAARKLAAGTQRARVLLGLVATGGIVALVAALPTWVDLPGSLRITQAIGTTSNPGNLRRPLPLAQAFGTWLSSSYRQVPSGGQHTLSYVLAAITLAAGVVGGARLLRVRAYALAGWMALTLAVGGGLIAYGTTWSEAKTLMLTSPIVMLAAWGGVAALRRSPLRFAAPMLALALVVGVSASDAMQYHGSDLAPTARYRELASLNARFAGRGPALFTDFDEYALYELRALDIGGPDFIYPPVALRSVAPSHGMAVDLDRVRPAALLAYPLIVTRRNPSASSPPTAYRLLWQGVYYQVWGRRPGAPAALAHLGLAGRRSVRCKGIRAIAGVAAHRGATLVAASAPELVPIPLARTSHPAWRYRRPLLTMSRAGRLQATFRVPRSGAWELWLRGEIMPAVRVGVDGRPLGTIAAELSGSSYNPSTAPPLRVRLAAGRHRLTIVRGGFSLAPGDGGAATLRAIFLTPAGADRRQTLRAIPAARWRSLCPARLDWVEALPRARPFAGLSRGATWTR